MQLSSLPALFVFSLSLLVSRHPTASARPAPHLPPDPTTSFSDLKRYLNRFGYLDSAANFTDSFDATLESAIARYQVSLGLPATARLDHATLALINSPRCGVPDTVGVQKFAFFSGQPRWTRPSPITLSYAVSPTATIDYVDQAEIRAVVKKAFNRWAAVIPVRFTEAAEYGAADVKLGFYTGDHGDGEAFDGVLGVLAHAFSPESGRLHLDAAERWSVDFGKEGSEVAVDLESVVTHEIGHVLGLAHSTVRDAVMYPSLSPRTKKVDLRADDVEGVQALYGSNPDFRLSSLLAAETSSPSPEKLVRVGGYNSFLIVVLSIVAVACVHT